MNRFSRPVVAMVAGVGLMLLAPLVVSVAPSGTFWRDADAEQLQKASADFHAASYGLPQSTDGRVVKSRGSDRYDPVAAKTKYEEAKATYETQLARLDAARARPTWMKWGLRLLGMTLAAWGVYGYFTRPPHPRRPLPPRTIEARANDPQADIAERHR